MDSKASTHGGDRLHADLPSHSLLVERTESAGWRSPLHHGEGDHYPFQRPALGRKVNVSKRSVEVKRCCRYFGIINVEHDKGTQVNEVDLEYDFKVELLDRNDP